MMKLKKTLTLPAADLSGFEPPLEEEEAAIQASVHRFAKEVLRPLGTELDRMSGAVPAFPWKLILPFFGHLPERFTRP